MSEETVATRDWHTRAVVRILEDAQSHSPEGGLCNFHKGQEETMVQWGNKGQPVRRTNWWTDFDIDGAHIIEASKVEVVRVIDEILPE